MTDNTQDRSIVLIRNPDGRFLALEKDGFPFFPCYPCDSGGYLGRALVTNGALAAALTSDLGIPVEAVCLELAGSNVGNWFWDASIFPAWQARLRGVWMTGPELAEATAPENAKTVWNAVGLARTL